MVFLDPFADVATSTVVVIGAEYESDPANTDRYSCCFQNTDGQRGGYTAEGLHKRSATSNEKQNICIQTNYRRKMDMEAWRQIAHRSLWGTVRKAT